MNNSALTGNHHHIKLTPGQLMDRYNKLKKVYGIEFAKGYEFAYKRGVYCRGFTMTHGDIKDVTRVYFEIFDCGDTMVAKNAIVPLMTGYFKSKTYELFRLNNSQPVFYAQLKTFVP